jgi:hypothetical protein
MTAPSITVLHQRQHKGEVQDGFDLSQRVLGSNPALQVNVIREELGLALLR